MSTITLEKGTLYRGRAIIFHSSIFVTKSAVRSGLEDLGFSGVIVWFDADDLPSDWPANKKNDESGSGETQAWLEGTWSKQTQQLPSSNEDFSLIDYWIQKRAEQPIQPPICLQNGVACISNSQCCSEYCINGLCGEKTQPINNQPPVTQPPYEIPPVFYTGCGSDSMSCVIDSDCCKGLYCQDGYCGIKQSTTNVSDISVSTTTKKWSWTSFFGGLAFGIITTGIGIKHFGK